MARGALRLQILAILALISCTKTVSVAVQRTGTGSGRVASTPAGIDCGARCAADFPSGAQVTLTATANGGSSFTGWSGDCSGTATCVFTPGKPASVVASFTRVLATAPPAFPLAVSPNGRYLQDQNGAPFPILGDAGWSAPHNLTLAEISAYLDDRVARGFNAILVEAVEHQFSRNPPRNAAGNLPFAKRLDGSPYAGALSYGDISKEAPDFSSAGGDYWTFLDSVLSLAEQKGVAVLLFPAYIGYNGGSEGWMAEMVANGPARLQAYGAFVATRLQGRANLIWVDGGDYFPSTAGSPSQEDCVNAVLAGVKSVAGAKSVLHTGHWNSPSISTDEARFAASMSLNGAYSFQGNTSGVARAAYAFTPARPAFLFEEPYEGEGPDDLNKNPAATEPLRRFEWWGWLSSIGGYVFGNGHLWPFPGNWASSLDSQGARDMSQLNAFIQSIPWHTLVPSGLDGQRTLVTQNGSSPGNPDVITAAASRDGAWLVAYVPPAWAKGSFSVDMTALRGATRARWLNPVTGAFTDAGAGLPNAGERSFSPPRDNGSGFTDWVLVLDAP